MFAQLHTATFKKVLRAALLACGLLLSLQSLPAAAQPAAPDGAHAFDFEFGTWRMHLKRRLKPLTGSNSWVEYEGVSVVRKVWDGKANLGEIDLTGPAGRIQGMSLRLYNPATGQWGVSFSNSADGTLGPPMVGGFKDGRGEFYNQETFNGRAIFVRFIFSEITADSFRIEQAFSDDGGKSWETNWTSTFTRTP